MTSFSVHHDSVFDVVFQEAIYGTGACFTARKLDTCRRHHDRTCLGPSPSFLCSSASALHYHPHRTLPCVFAEPHAASWNRAKTRPSCRDLSRATLYQCLSYKYEKLKIIKLTSRSAIPGFSTCASSLNNHLDIHELYSLFTTSPIQGILCR
jgi:hypothetical protein